MSDEVYEITKSEVAKTVMRMQDMRTEIDSLEARNKKLERVVEATRYFMKNDKTGGLTGSKQVVDALEALDE